MPSSFRLLLLTGALSLLANASGASANTNNDFYARRSQSSVDDAGTPVNAKWIDADFLNPNTGNSALPPGDEKKKDLKPIPQYVLDHAPLVHLSEEETYWPSLLEEHLQHTIPYLNYASVNRSHQHPNLDELGLLNNYGGQEGQGGEHMYLHSRDAVEDNPSWLTSGANTPVEPQSVNSEGGNVTDSHYMTIGGEKGDKRAPRNKDGEIICRPSRSNAPAYLVLVEHPEQGDVVHAFWFFFYSFNLGNSVFGVGFGDHVGDWEHSVVRFRDGKPESMFVSEHTFGQSYKFSAMEKYVEEAVASDTPITHTSVGINSTHLDLGFGLGGDKDKKPEGKRPVIYSGKGTHAMYATAGIQAYILPFTILHDTTSRGPLWDPTLNMRSYWYTSPKSHDCSHVNKWHPDCDDRKMTDIPSESELSADADVFNTGDDFPSSHSHSESEDSDNPYAEVEKTLTPTAENPEAPISWFYFNGRWGDKEYLKSDARQYHAPIVGEKKYVDGPHGPRFKGMGRLDICPSDKCTLRSTRAPRLWVFNWLYNWAWLVGVWVFLTIAGITAMLVVRHARRTHTGAWKLWVRWQGRRRERRARKIMADIERSPLLSEASETDVESVVSMEGGINGSGGGYGTVRPPREDREEWPWRAGHVRMPSRKDED